MSTILEHSFGQEDSLPWPEQVQWQASNQGYLDAPICCSQVLE